MEILACIIEDLLEKELSLYKQLHTILEKEKRYIVDMDIDCLWETTAQKKQIVLKLGQIEKRVHRLMENKHEELSLKSQSLKFSDFIEKLPVPRKIKSRLRKIKLGLETYKKSVSTLGLANKTYIIESISVINDIVSTIADKVNREQYSNCGNLLENKKKKRFISAEV